jgi:hypothetical protein
MTFLVDPLQHSSGRVVWISWRRPNHKVGSLRDRERLKEAYTRYEGFLYSLLQNTVVTRRRRPTFTRPWEMHAPKIELPCNCPPYRHVCRVSNERVDPIMEWAVCEIVNDSRKYTRYEGFLYSPLQNHPEARLKEHSCFTRPWEMHAPKIELP